MGYLTKYGSFWGMLPQTQGRIFWVSPADTYTVEGRTYSASDNHDGLSPERALRTIDYAVGLCTADVGDVIVLLQGAHSVSATVAVDVAGITITGIPGDIPLPGMRGSAASFRRRARVVSTQTAGIVFTVSATDVEICHIHFDDIIAGQNISATNAADRLYVHDCTFLMDTADDTATMGVQFTLGTGTTTVNDDSLIRNCYFRTTSNAGPAVRAAGTVLGLTIENCTFIGGATAWDDVIESITAGSEGLLIRDCDFTQRTGVDIVDCIDVTGMTTDHSTKVYRCYFPEGADAIEATATPDVTCAENYLSTQTGGALTGSI